MSVQLTEIDTYLEQIFSYSSFEDSSLNGLQVETNQEVNKLGAAVDFSLSTTLKAADEGVDLLITHHGLLWGKQEKITGVLSEKIKLLYDNYINLMGIHLPLDAHSEFGNNIIIAKILLGLTDLDEAIPYGGLPIGWKGDNKEKHNLVTMADIMSDVPGGLKNPLILANGPTVPEKVCVVSGGSADSVFLHEKEGFDTFIGGEPKQYVYHYCKEHNLNAIFAGHYATETFGVRYLCEHLSQKYSLDWTFIDEPTGI